MSILLASGGHNLGFPGSCESQLPKAHTRVRSIGTRPGDSPRRRRICSVRYITHGVLPVAPNVKLPTEMTGKVGGEIRRALANSRVRFLLMMYSYAALSIGVRLFLS